MMAKFTLDIVDDYPCIVYGINATTSDYRMGWNSNILLGTSLKKVEPLSAFSKVNEGALHNHFSFSDENLQISYHLVENRRGSSIFLPEVDKADFLLIIDGVEDSAEQIEILDKLKGIRAILMAFRVDIERLKHKQNLLYIG